jgi:hypothetical protein
MTAKPDAGIFREVNAGYRTVPGIGSWRRFFSTPATSGFSQSAAPSFRIRAGKSPLWLSLMAGDSPSGVSMVSHHSMVRPMEARICSEMSGRT